MPFNCQIKIRQFFFSVRMYIIMAIPYHTAKFKSANSVKNVVWGKTAKFNDRQYFRLYGIVQWIVYNVHVHVVSTMWETISQW